MITLYDLSKETYESSYFKMLGFYGERVQEYGCNSILFEELIDSDELCYDVIRTI